MPHRPRYDAMTHIGDLARAVRETREKELAARYAGDHLAAERYRFERTLVWEPRYEEAVSAVTTGRVELLPTPGATRRVLPIAAL